MSFNAVSSSDLAHYFNGTPTENLKESSSAVGLVWEIPLEEESSPCNEKLQELAVFTHGPTFERKVTVMVLPVTATEKEIEAFSLSMGSRTLYEEVVTDYRLKEGSEKLKQKPASSTMFHYLLGLRRKAPSLQRYILKNPEAKEMILECGEKIYHRIESRIDDYSFSNPGRKGLCLKKCSLKEALGNKTPSQLNSDEEKVDFYIELIFCLALHYREKYGIASADCNLKEIAFKSICMSASLALKQKAKQAHIAAALLEDKQLNKLSDLRSRLNEKKMELGDPKTTTVAKAAEIVGYSIEELQLFVPSITAETPYREFIDSIEQYAQNIAYDHLHAEYEVESENEIAQYTLFPEKEKEMQTLLEESDEEIEEHQTSLLLLNMYGMLTDKAVENYFAKQKAYKEAWRSGNMAELVRHAGCVSEFERMTYNEAEQAAQKIVENINRNRSSLFILPMGFAASNFSLSRYLNSRNISITRIVREKPQEQAATGVFYKIMSKEGALVGHLLGTIHMANEKIMRLNLPILKALEKAHAIYFEIDLLKAKDHQPSNYISSLVHLDKEGKEKLAVSLKLLFPKLILKLQAEGTWAFTIRNFQKHFEHGSLIDRFNLISTLLSKIKLNKAKVIRLMEQPVGLDHLIMEYAAIHSINTHGLEEDTFERINMVNKISKNQLLTLLLQLPTSADEVDQFLASNENQLVDLCETWIKGDVASLNKEDFFNEEDSTSLFTERNIIMANGIHAALTNRTGQETLFFAVGFLHLIGDDNIATQLSEKKWKIEKI